jgi:hypothetical protein
MLDKLLVPYVVVLLALPLLAQWRFGIVSALVVTAGAIGFVILTHRHLVDNGFLPIVLSGPPAEHPKAKIWQDSIAAIQRDMDWLYMPALAAVTGGLLSVLWSAVLWLRRAVARYG